MLTRLSNKFLVQGYVENSLESSLEKFYGRYGDLIKQYEVPFSWILNDIPKPDQIQWQLSTDQNWNHSVNFLPNSSKTM